MTLRRILIAALLLGGTITAAAASPAQAATPDRWAFGYMQDPTPPGGMLLDANRQFKSDGALDIRVWPTVVGRYRVVMPGIASRNGVAHVTAVAPDARFCQVFHQFASGTDQIVEVQCYKHNPAPAPDWSRFAILYSTSSTPFGPAAEAYAYVRAKSTGGTLASFNSARGANAVSHGGIGSGVYKVWLPGVSTRKYDGNIQVTAEHPNSPRRCKVDNWWPGPGGHDILVRCYDQAGAPADSWFNLTYHRERSVFGAANKFFAYLWTPGYPGGPSNYNSAGSVNKLISSGLGLSYAEFHKVGYGETHVQVTAFGHGAGYCNLQEVWHIGGGVAVVRNVICFNAAGARDKNDFFISYTSRA